jgi:hypothetical protein
MKLRPFALAIAAVLSLPCAKSGAQTPSTPVLSFHFVRAGLPVPEYTFTLQPDGTGTYQASYVTQPPSSKFAPTYANVPPPPPVATTRPIALSTKTTAMLFERVRSADNLRACESKAKNIADTGAKTISYTGPEGPAHCTYNYTENKSVAAITETFQAIAETLDEGHAIELTHRYDRLGLDHQLILLADNVREGRAMEVATIAPILQALCDDTLVMERVRKRAAGLLQASAVGR